MIDLGVSKLALVGAIALIVLGPEKLPKVARTVGTLLGKAQRYVADVKAEVNRSMELDELKKMKESMETAARDVEQQIQTSAADFEKDWAQATGEASKGYEPDAFSTQSALADGTYPVYKRPNKRWRNKVSAMPSWYKARAGVRTRALSGAARVARYRPRRLG